MAKKDMRTWILIKGKAFSAELNEEQMKELKTIVENIKDHKAPSAKEIGLELTASGAWKELMKQLKEKKKLLATGKLDLTPDRKRSDFMR